MKETQLKFFDERIAFGFDLSDMIEHVKCINDEDMYIQSEEGTKNFASVKIILEHCKDSNPAE